LETGETGGIKPPPDPRYRHRFPAELISHTVWLYHVLSLGLRGVASARSNGSNHGSMLKVSSLPMHSSTVTFIHAATELPASDYRSIRSDAFKVWRQETYTQRVADINYRLPG
jgi:hypothetical protein